MKDHKNALSTNIQMLIPNPIARQVAQEATKHGKQIVEGAFNVNTKTKERSKSNIVFSKLSPSCNDSQSDKADPQVVPLGGAGIEMQCTRNLLQDDCNRNLLHDAIGRRLSLAEPVYIPGYSDPVDDGNPANSVDFSTVLDSRKNSSESSNVAENTVHATRIIAGTRPRNQPILEQECNDYSAGEEKAKMTSSPVTTPKRRSLTNDELLNMVREYIRNTKPPPGKLKESDDWTDLDCAASMSAYDDTMSTSRLRLNSNLEGMGPFVITASGKYQPDCSSKKPTNHKRKSRERYDKGESHSHATSRSFTGDCHKISSSRRKDRSRSASNDTLSELRMNLRPPQPPPEGLVDRPCNTPVGGVSAREKRLRYMEVKHTHHVEKYSVKKCDVDEFGKPPKRSAARMRLTMANPCKTTYKRRPCLPPKHSVKLNKTANLRFRTRKYCGRSRNVSLFGGTSVSRNDATYKNELMKAMQDKRKKKKSKLEMDLEARMRPHLKSSKKMENACGVEHCRVWNLRDDEPLVGNECALENKKCLERKHAVRNRSTKAVTPEIPMVDIQKQINSMVAVVVSATSLNTDPGDANVVLNGEDANKSALVRAKKLESKFKEFVFNKCTITT